MAAVALSAERTALDTDAANPTGQDGSRAVPVYAGERESFANSSFVMGSEGTTHTDN